MLHPLVTGWMGEDTVLKGTKRTTKKKKKAQPVLTASPGVIQPVTSTEKGHEPCHVGRVECTLQLLVNATSHTSSSLFFVNVREQN